MNKLLKHRLHTILFFLFLVLLILPAAHNFFNGKEVRPLKGYFKQQNAPSFYSQNWLDGNYQDSLNSYIKGNFGYRSLFIRTNNQINFSLYNQISTRNVFSGKENYLYEGNYIYSYFGLDYIGKDSIREKVRKLQCIKDTLQKLGTDLVIVFAPGKGSYYPEFFPTKYDTFTKSISNYDQYLQCIDTSHLNFINFKSWFLDLKRSSNHVLFPKTGVHWSKYGEMIAADSLLKYISVLKENSKGPKIIVDTLKYSSNVRDTDDDIEQSMNLLFDITDLNMTYPQFHYKIEDSSARPRVITVADSYYWGMYNFGLSVHAFNNSPFWYYHKQSYSGPDLRLEKISQMNIQAEVENSDVILLLSTDANLRRFAFGWIEDVYAIYFP